MNADILMVCVFYMLNAIPFCGADAYNSKYNQRAFTIYVRVFDKVFRFRTPTAQKIDEEIVLLEAIKTVHQ